MAESTRRKFYSAAAVERQSGGLYRVMLDGRPLRTPAGKVVELPNAALAEAVAAEWQAQGQEIRPRTMPLTRLVHVACDHVSPHREAMIAQVLNFGRTDLLCYRAEGPAELVARQRAAWDPHLAWARERFGIALNTGTGIAFVAQPQADLETLRAVLSAMDDLALTALHGAAALCGSLVLALALAEGVIDASAAFAASQVDPDYQAEKWGRDVEAEQRAGRIAQDLRDVARFLALLRSGAN